MVVRHVPSGLTVRCEAERSQHSNRAEALAVLRARLFAEQRTRRDSDTAERRKKQVGSGMRGDKRRTIRSDGVTDHLSGRTWTLRDYQRGNW